LCTNAGQRWSRIFKGKNSSENGSFTVTVFPYALYLGTKSGLFISKDNGRTWLKASGSLGRSQIFNLAYPLQAPDYLYVSSVDGLFISINKGETWEKIFAGHMAEDSPEQAGLYAAAESGIFPIGTGHGGSPLLILAQIRLMAWD